MDKILHPVFSFSHLDLELEYILLLQNIRSFERLDLFKSAKYSFLGQKKAKKVAFTSLEPAMDLQFFTQLCYFSDVSPQFPILSDIKK